MRIFKLILVAALIIPAIVVAHAPAAASDPREALRTPDYSQPGGVFSISAVNTVVTPLQVAKAMEGTPNIVRAATFVNAPTFGGYKGVSDSPLTTFPSVGSTFGLISSGNAAWAPNANTAGSTSANNGAAPIRGNSAYDAVVLEVDLGIDPRQLVNCVSIEYRFLSEEYPEWVGSGFNDAFVAEITTSSWTANNAAVAAPENFAFSGTNEIISINGVGSTTQMNAAAAAGTTYDGATPHYYAEAPLPLVPQVGADGLNHYFLYLTVFDQSDAIYDTTVFIDNIQLRQVIGCAPAPSTVLYP